MTDIIYISEVSNYRLLNASFRIELAVVEMRALLFLQYFPPGVLKILRPHNFNSFRKFIDLPILTGIYLASFGIICLISLSILILANLIFDFLLF